MHRRFGRSAGPAQVSRHACLSLPACQLPAAPSFPLPPGLLLQYIPAEAASLWPRPSAPSLPHSGRFPRSGFRGVERFGYNPGDYAITMNTRGAEFTPGIPDWGQRRSAGAPRLCVFSSRNAIFSANLDGRETAGAPADAFVYLIRCRKRSGDAAAPTVTRELRAATRPPTVRCAPLKAKAFLAQTTFFRTDTRSTYRNPRR